MVMWFRNLINKFKKINSYSEQPAKERALNSMAESKAKDSIIPKSRKKYRIGSQAIMEANKEQIISWLSEKNKRSAIADKLGINPKTLCGWIKKNHIVPGQQSLPFEETEISHKTRANIDFEKSRQVIATLLGDGYKVKQVAAMYGRPGKSLQNWLFRNELSVRELRGETETSTDFFNDNEVKIFSLLRKGKTPYFIAKVLERRPQDLYRWLKRFEPREVLADIVDQTERQYAVRKPSSAF